MIGIGYEGLIVDQLVARLQAEGVEVLVDVRMTPLSRKPGFSKRALSEALSAAGIRYVHDRRLGNPKDNRAAYADASSDAGATARARYREMITSGDGAEAVAEAIQRRFDDLDYLFDIGDIDLNISGCMNACGHHHVGHIGILGVDKKGQEFYQVSLGGNAGRDASLAQILGPSFAQDDMPDVVDKIIKVYVEQRTEEESFLDTYRRIGIDPFKERVYAANH